MSYRGKYDNINAMMEFTELLKSKPEDAYDFISSNTYRFTKEGLADILKEVLYSMRYHTNNSFYGDLHKNILGDVQIELDENYDEAYVEYMKWLSDISLSVKQKNESMI